MKRNFRNSKFILFFLLFFLLIPSIAGISAPSFPSPTAYKYVNDYANIISQSETEKIVSIGKELEDKTGAQAVIVTIDSTDNVPIEDYANKLFRTWGIGQREENNGLLILVSLNDRQFRVEVGSGLEGAIPDALSNRVMESLAKPKFAENNYSLGLLESYSAFSDLIAKEYNITLDKSLNITLPSSTQSRSSSNGLLVGGSIFGLILLDFIFNRGRVSNTLLNILFISNINRRGPRGGSGGSGFGGFGGGSSNGGGSSGNW